VDDDVVDFLAPYLCAPAPSPAAQPEAESPDFLEQLLTELIDEYNSDTEEQALVHIEQQEWDEAAQSDGEAVGSEVDDVEAAQKAPDAAEAAQETPDVSVTPTAVEEDVSEKFVDNYEDMLISLGIEDLGYGFKDRMSGKIIGRIQGPFFEDCWKAICQQHKPRCSVLLNSHLPNACRTRSCHDLLQWLKCANDDASITAAKHEAMGTALKKVHGMRVR